MKRYLSYLSSNWGLKLLALTLAIAVYYSMKESTATARHLDYSPAAIPFQKGPAHGGK